MRYAKALFFLSISFAIFAILNAQLLRVLNGMLGLGDGLGEERKAAVAARPKISAAASRLKISAAASRLKTAHGSKGNCSSNEVVFGCSGLNCPEKACEDIWWPDSPRRSFGPDIQHICICALGFYRKGDPDSPFNGPCVKKAACEAGKKKGDYQPTQACGTNEEWDDCHSGTCPGALCAHLQSDLETNCTKDCKSGCICALGFYRKGEPDRPFAGPCVKKAACEAGKKKGDHQPAQACGTNEVWDRCHSSSCPGDSCARFQSENRPLGCFLDCVPGCICAGGFFRKGALGHPYAGPCVPRSECTSSGGKLSFKIEVEGLIPKGVKASKNTK